MKLATIEKIHSIQAHPNADALEVAKIKAWPVVIKKGEYKEGDLVVFIVIDSIVPEANPYFAFLKDRHFRVWNAKFRGAPSQGLVCPLSILPPRISCLTNEPSPYITGDDVTKLLGVIKYEKPIDASIAGDTAGHFPSSIIPITDEENLLNNPDVLHELYGKQCYLTVKCDGSSCTIIRQGDTIRVCSRRLEQKEGTGFWKLVESTGLLTGLRSLNRNLAIQAEACGGKIQANKMDLVNPSLFIFDVRNLDTGAWFCWNELKTASELFKVPTVPVIQEDFIFDETWTIDRLQTMANGVKYKQRNGQERAGEGIVLRPVIPCWSEVLGRKLSVKILNVDYKQ